MTIAPETLDEVEEIYLTEDEFEHWFSSDTIQPEVLHVEGTSLLLQDWAEPYSDPWLQPDRSQLRAMIERAGYFSPKLESPPQPDPIPPKPAARKLTRSDDAVWTLFRCGLRVIAVNEKGEAAVRHTTFAPLGAEERRFSWKSFWAGYWRMRISEAGALILCDCQQTIEELAEIGTDDIIKGIRTDVKAWVSRKQVRRMPRGIPQLLKRIAEARKIYPPLTKEEVEARVASILLGQFFGEE